VLTNASGPCAADIRRLAPEGFCLSPSGFVEQLRYFLLIPLGVGFVHPVLIFLVRVLHTQAEDHCHAANEQTKTSHAYLPIHLARWRTP
jgi:hypothetical protein